MRTRPLPSHRNSSGEGVGPTCSTVPECCTRGVWIWEVPGGGARLAVATGTGEACGTIAPGTSAPQSLQNVAPSPSCCRQLAQYLATVMSPPRVPRRGLWSFEPTLNNKPLVGHRWLLGSRDRETYIIFYCRKIRLDFCHAIAFVIMLTSFSGKSCMAIRGLSFEGILPGASRAARKALRKVSISISAKSSSMEAFPLSRIFM